jgi:hypothetical protein
MSLKILVQIVLMDFLRNRFKSYDVGEKKALKGIFQEVSWFNCLERSREVFVKFLNFFIRLNVM